MANRFMRVDAKGLARKLTRGIAASKAVMREPMRESRGAQAVKILRFGTRGISDQFKDETEYRGSGSAKWGKTQPFGNRKAPYKTMQASGAYRAAWLGGAGGVENISANAIEIGVEKELFPQVAIHQKFYSSTRVRPKEKIESGRHKGEWKMRWFLGLTYGVWLTNARVGMGFKINRRRLSLSNAVRKAVAGMVTADTKKKMGMRAQVGPVLTP